MSIQRYDCTNGGAQWCQGCYTMEPSNFGDYVHYDDHTRILTEKDAEIERLRAQNTAALQALKDSATARDEARQADLGIIEGLRRTIERDAQFRRQVTALVRIEGWGALTAIMKEADQRLVANHDAAVPAGEGSKDG